MVPLNKVKEIITKHNILEKELSSGQIDPKIFAKSKEYSSLGNIIEIAKKFVNFENEKDLVHIIQDKSNDQDMIELAQKDLNE